MALPLINESIVFQKIQLPSGKSVSIRGWKVKEEKELLFAAEKIEDNDIEKAKVVASFLKSCVKEKNIFDQLSENDLKKMSIEIRKLAKGDEVEYTARCSNEECGYTYDDVLKLSKSEKIKEFDLTPLKLNDDLTIAFKDLALDKFIELRSKYLEEPAKLIFYYLINSIEAITYQGQTYVDFSEEEIENFIDQLTSNDLTKMYEEYEKRVSSVKLEKKNKCKKCGIETPVVIEDILSFLIL